MFWSQREWDHEVIQIWGRRTDWSPGGPEGHVMKVWPQAVMTKARAHTRLMWGVIPLSVYSVVAASCPLASGVMLFLWDRGRSVLLCVSLCFCETPALSGSPNSPLPPLHRFHKTQSHMGFCWQQQWWLKINDAPQLATFHISLWRQAFAKSERGGLEK